MQDKIQPRPHELTEEFIIAHADIVDWEYVSKTIYLREFSEEFFHRFHEEIHWDWICWNPSVTTKFAHRYEEYIGAKCWFFMGRFHRHDDLPAVERHDGAKEWWYCGKRHRLNGPAYITSHGTKAWFINGKYHRENDLPAVEYFYGEKKWYKHDELHRENGPAITYPDGTKFWYKDGKRHREDGPATMYAHGKHYSCYYHLNDKQYLESQYKFKLFQIKFKRKINSIFEFLKRIFEK